MNAAKSNPIKLIAASGLLMLMLALMRVHGAETNAPAAKVFPGLKNAVVLVIRHGEKTDTNGDLSPAGYQRAEAYVKYFKNYKVDGKPLKLDYLAASADSTNSRRVRLTVEPLGKALGLKIDDRVANKSFQNLVDELQAQDHGRRILICWHHKQIPNLITALGADPEKLLPGGKWPDDVFSWVLELHYDDKGVLIPSKTKRVMENLMPGDKKQGKAAKQG